MKRKLITSTVIIGVLSAMAFFVWAAETYPWPFSLPGSYTVYKGDGTEDTSNTDIVVVGDLVRLVGQSVATNDDTVGLADSGATTDKFVRTSSGPDTDLVLTSSGGNYAASGTFTSRVFDGGAGNTWQRISASMFNTALDNTGTELGTGESGLVALYHMNNGWNDAKGSNHGTAYGNATIDTVDKKMGAGAGTFDGTGDYVTFPTNAYSGLTNTTTTAWLKITAYSSDNVGIVHCWNGTQQIALDITASGVPEFWINGARRAVATTPIGTGRWVHLAYVTNGTSAIIYVNGEQVASGAWSSAIATSSQAMYSMNRSDFAVYMNGKLDELAIFNTALSADTIARHYANGAAVKFQVRSGTGTTLSGDSVGPDGTTASYYAGVGDTLVTDASGTVSFDTSHRYVQYRAYLTSSADWQQTPIVASVTLANSGGAQFDTRLGDFNIGTSNDTVRSITGDQYVGLTKMINGGYNTSGAYTSQVFDAGSSVSWNSIAWTEGKLEIPASESGLVGLWHLNGTVDAAIANNATVTAAVGTNGTAKNANGTGMSYKAGKLNQAIDFNSGAETDDYVLIGNAGSVPLELRLTRELSLEVWIYATDCPVNELRAIVACQDDGSFSGYSMILDCRANSDSQTAPSGHIHFQIGDGGYHVTNVNAAVPLNEWVHVVVTRKANENAKIYYNGVSQPLTSASWTGNITYTNTELAIGMHTDYAGRYFKGRIDEVAIYNRALTASEVADHYKNASPGTIKFQVHSGADAAALPSSNFVGSDGTAATFYSTSGESLSSVTGRYFQYKAYLDENGGVATPKLKTVTIANSAPATLVDDIRSEFDSGTYSSKTQWYPNQVRLADLSVSGPSEVVAGTSGLVGLWHMNNAWTDDTANANNGTAVGGATFTTVSKLGSHAGSFDGTDDYVSVANHASLNPSYITVFAWVKGTFSKDYNHIVGKESTGSPYGWEFLVRSTGKLAPYLRGTAAQDIHYDASGAYTLDGNWHLVAFTYDGSYLTGYVDGRVDNTVAGSGGGLATSVTNPLTIGGGSVWGNRYFTGQIDELAIYNRALSANEIAMHAGVGYRYPTSGTNTFISGAIDAGSIVNWGSLSWNEDSMGYGEALTTASTPVAVSTDTPGLVSLWKMDNNWTDSKGSNNGTASGDATFDAVNMKVGAGAGTFDGTGDYVEKLNPTGLPSGTSSFTMELWFKPGRVNHSATQNIFNFGTEALNTWVYFSMVSGTDKVRIEWWGGGGSAISTTSLVAGNWYHLVGVYNGTQSKIYVNGILEATTSFSLSNLGTGVFRMGKYSGGQDTQGTFDEAAIYNRALTASEINQHYMDQVGNYGLVGLWHMDEASGAIVDSISANNGTQSGGVTYSASGKFGTALSFDGTNDYVGLGTVLLNTPTTGTVEMWVNAGANGINYGGNPWENTTLLSKDTVYMSLIQLNSNKIRAYYYNTLGGYSYDDSTSAVTVGVWAHIAYTWNASGSNLYINGVREVSSTNTWTNVNSGHANQTLDLGRCGTSGRFFNGKVDEFAIWNRVLSAGEISDHYARGTANLKMQVSIDNGATWKNASGTADQFITQSPATLNLVGNSQTIKYRATLSTEDRTLTPKLQGVTFGRNSYPTNNPYVIPTTGQAYTGYLTSFAQTPGPNNLGTIKYQVTVDGTNWKYWDGAAWSAATLGYSHASTAADINTNIASLYETFGTGTFKFKAFLNSTGLQPVELNTVVLGFASGVLTLTAPNTGVSWIAGTAQDITWTSAGTVGDITLKYSTDAGATYPNTIATGPTVTSPYSWTVPATGIGTTVRVRVEDSTDATGVHDASEVNFTIAAPTITLTQPEGGDDSWIMGTHHNIEWTKVGAVTADSLTIKLSTDGGVTYPTTIATGVSATSPYDWTVTDIGNAAEADCRIWIYDASRPATQDVSNGNFTIALPTITLTAPDGGEQWLASAPHNITWTSVGAVSGSPTLQYSTDSGSTWTNISAGTPITSPYSWTPTGINSVLARVKIIDGSKTAVSDTSDADFDISRGTISITSPNGAEGWYVHELKTITWTSAGTVDGNLTLQYKCGAGTWQPIATGQANDGSYENWLVPDSVSASCLVRIFDQNQSATVDQSDAVFSIVEPTITITAPNTNVSWIATNAYNVTWTSTAGVSDNLTLLYSTNGGSTYPNQITTGKANNGTYSWTIPSDVSSTVRVKIVDGDRAATFDSSDVNFAILATPTITVTAPNGGESWYSNTAHDITWTTTGAISTNLEIRYSTDNGSTWPDAKIIATGNLTSPRSWTVPDDTSSTVKIKITDLDAPVVTDRSNNPFVILAPTIAVTSPNGSENWTALSSKSITWSASAGVHNNLTIEYSTDSGSTWNAIAGATGLTASTGTYTWNPLPDIADSQCRIRITDASRTATADTSNADFTISSPSVLVTAPNGTESWKVGTAHSITWDSSDMVSDNLTIEYSVNGGTSWATVAGGTGQANDGTYAWTVPSNMSATVLVKITDAGHPATTDQSNAVFTIATPTITVTAPNGGESWLEGQQQNITWTSEGTVSANLTIEYSTNAGVDWIGISTGQANDGTYAWTVPDAVGTSVRVKVTDADRTTATDTSNANFAITAPTITITAPNTAVSWKVGTAHDITWTSSASVSQLLKIQYSVDSGSTWADIATNQANDGTYSWTVPNAVGSQVRIKIFDTLRTATFDTSDVDFAIANPTIAITAPNGGESWIVGTDHPITWTSAGTINNNLTLQYSANNGGAFNAIDSGQLNSGTYTWTVPDAVSAQALARIFDAGRLAATDDSDAVFSIATPVIVVTAPNGGEEWVMNKSSTIAWGTTGSFSNNITLKYSIDGGSTWTDIATGQPNSSSYVWAIPAALSGAAETDARIKVLDGSRPAAVDTSDANFTILTAPTITITSPNGAEEWKMGTSHNITWDSSAGVSNNLRISYTSDNGATWTDIVASGQANGGTRAWTVPNTETALYKIRITDMDAQTITDQSNAVFSVVSSTIAVSAPASGAVWVVGSPQTISWSSVGTVNTNSLTIQYSTDSGSSWTNIATGEANDGSYSWVAVPNVASSTSCLIKIFDASHAATTDNSDAFTIGASFAVTAPNDGERWYALKNHNITWNTVTGTAANVKLELSTNSGSSWTTIVSSTSNDGSYTFTFPDIHMADNTALVRVSDVLVPSTNDISNAGFKIDYYDVVWEVKQGVTHLDLLSVVDSSGWSAGTLTSPQTHSYPHGTYTTTWARVGYWDNAVRSWSTTDDVTKPVSMTASNDEPEYRVMSNFAYNGTSNLFRINSWIERGGIIMTAPTNCTIKIYDNDGTQIDANGVTAGMNIYSAAPDANGVFWQSWATSGLATDHIYFARVDIVYSGVTYSAGLTYNVNIPEKLELIGGGGSSDTQSILDAIGNVQNSVGSGLAAKVDGVVTDVNTIETSVGANLTGQVTSLQNSLNTVATNVTAILEDTGVTLPAYLDTKTNEVKTKIETELAKGTRAQILTRSTTIAPGDTMTVRYRTVTGLGPKISVYNASNVLKVNEALMAEIGATGVYEYDLTVVNDAAWGIGDYTIICAEATKNSTDSMVLSVGSSDISTISSNITALSTSISNVGLDVDAILAKWGNETAAQLSTNINTLLTQIGTGNIAAIKTATNTIAWGDVTGLVTTAGAIKAKTDTIDWTQVAAVKTKTDTINWLDVTGIKAKTDTILWTDVTTANTNIATLMGEIGVGNIAAIKTKTQDINWLDVQDIVTKTGSIQQKTNPIDWSQVTAIRTKTETINWDNVTGIKLKTDSINWGDVTGMRNDLTSLAYQIGTPNDTAYTNTVFGKIRVIQEKWGSRTAEELYGQTVGAFQMINQLQTKIGAGSTAGGGTMFEDLRLIKDFVNQVGTQITAVDNEFDTQVAALTTQVTSVGSQVSQVGTQVTSVGSELGTKVTSLGTDVGTQVAAVGTDLGTRVTAVGTDMGTRVATVGTDVGGMSGEIITNLDSKMDELLRGVVSGVQTSPGAAIEGLSSKMDMIIRGGVPSPGAITPELLAGLNYKLDTLLKGMASANTSVATIDTDLDNLATAVSVVDTTADTLTTNLATAKTSIDSIYSKLTSGVAVDPASIGTALSSVTALIGSTSDASSSSTVFGKIAGISGSLTSIGSDATNASTYAMNANSSATRAASAAEEVRAAVSTTGGTSDTTKASLLALSDKLSSVQSEVSKISSGISTDSLKAGLSEAMAKISEVAAASGLTGVEKLAQQPATSGEVKALQNKVEEIKAIMDVISRSIHQNVEAPITKTWYESGSVLLKVLIVNPSKEASVTVPVRIPLPKEATRDSVMDAGDLKLGFNPEKGLYEAYGNTTLKPGEEKVLQVRLKDIWRVPDEEISFEKGYATELVKVLKDNWKYAEAAKKLGETIQNRLDGILGSQNEELGPAKHIEIHRRNLVTMQEIKKDVAFLEKLAGEGKGPGGGTGAGIGGGDGDSGSSGSASSGTGAGGGGGGEKWLEGMTFGTGGGAEGKVAAETVILKVEVRNPSKTESAAIPVKHYLPKEILEKDVLESGILEVLHDLEQGRLYLYKAAVQLDPAAVKVFEVTIRDIWRLPEGVLARIQERAQMLAKSLEGTTFGEEANLLSQEILNGLSEVRQKQGKETGIGEHVEMFHQNLAFLGVIKQRIEKLEKIAGLVAVAPGVEIEALGMGKVQYVAKGKGGAGGTGAGVMGAGDSAALRAVAGSIFAGGAPATTTTWRIIFIIVGFLGVVSFLFFVLWWAQVRSERKVKVENIA